MAPEEPSAQAAERTLFQPHIAASIAKFGVNAPLLVDFKRIRFPGLEELIAGAEG